MSLKSGNSERPQYKPEFQCSELATKRNLPVLKGGRVYTSVRVTREEDKIGRQRVHKGYYRWGGV